MLVRSLAALDEHLDGALVVRHGNPVTVVPAVAAEVGAHTVHVSQDGGPYGRTRDDAVAGALESEGRRLIARGSPYAVPPGTLRTASGTPYRVFTPFHRAWLAQLEHALPPTLGLSLPPTLGLSIPPASSDPVDSAPALRWRRGPASAALPEVPLPAELRLPEAGEAAALRRWRTFLADRLTDYQEQRDRPGKPGTSELSACLKFGEIHPHRLLTELSQHPDRHGPGAAAFRAELCWREFHADVLWHEPGTARHAWRAQFDAMPVDDPGETLEAWQRGRTGFPLVDAGMRQLLVEGWMHNRVRMVTASFLVKDLHLDWRLGARWFLSRLRDGDLASNQLSWQWVAGCGTDAAPYFRVFNPVTQGLRFDPTGDYVRQYVPELTHLPGAAAHRPWDHADGYRHGYPPRLVDHAAERAEALRRYALIRG